ncbi:MAG: S-layer homology domain-containing protein [Oscillospiraceae bacterium]|nr:S-layer homology domain-containing protein [Oscillospiraceae bacterium]
MMKRNTGKTRKWLHQAAAGLLSLSLLLGPLSSAAPAWAAGQQVEQPSILTPAPEPQPEEENTLQPVNWAQEHIDKLVSWGVMRGDIAGNMEPERDITRAEFVAMVNRAYGYDQTGMTPFIDVEETAWYADDISIAYNVGYFQGISPRMADPDGNLTREQAVILLARNMMMDASSGETLGFSDSRDFSDWSRGQVEAAIENGVIDGYPDGTFRPLQNITRGEVAQMLVNAIGSPIQEPGDYALGNVYGNATISAPGVSLRNTVIAGDLYLTGGIGLGDVLLENVTVLGKIVASGAGESNRGDSSVILRNVTADKMIVDSISNQFVTVRAEGDTVIDEASIRTHGYVEDMTRDGLGLKHIALEGEPGTELQVAGNVKRVTNLTPDSRLVIAQGVAAEVTIDEKSTNSMTVIDNGARVKDLNLDVATSVSGSGDVSNLTVSAPGSIVTMLPDNITIRPGTTATIAGELMDHMGAAEATGDPMLLAGYPTVRDVAPTTAQAVFNANKRGTVYWAVSAVADGSVSEADVISPPSYGGKIVRSGRVPIDAANTEYTSQIAGLTSDGSYYLTAVLVDSRGQHSAVKVAAFTTPDDTVPAFANGYPIMSRTDKEADCAQVTVMTNKDCVLYYALMPGNSTAPTAQDFKTNSLNGNLGYGTMDMVKNSTTPINVNRVDLEEQVSYDLYLWLTDYNGANSSNVTKLTFTTADTTPPIIHSMEQTNAQATAVEMTYVISEPGTVFWAVVKEDDPFLRPVAGSSVVPSLDNEAAKMQVTNGVGALRSGRSAANQADTEIRFTISGLEAQGVYDLYYVAQDRSGNYSERVEKMTIRTLDNIPPTVIQEFTRYNGNDAKSPLPDTDIRLVFSESVQGMYTDERNQPVYEKFRSLYQDVVSASAGEKLPAREKLADALRRYIKLYYVPTYGQPVQVAERTSASASGDPWVIDYRYATVQMEDGEMVITFPTNSDIAISALNLASGATYYFRLEGILDTAIVPNRMGNTNLERFQTVPAQVDLSIANTTSILRSAIPNVNEADVSEGSVRVDLGFLMEPQSVQRAEDTLLWDALIWSDTSITFSLYSRPIAAGGRWNYEGQATINVAGAPQDGFAYKSLRRSFQTPYGEPIFDQLQKMVPTEYAIHISQIGSSGDYSSWSQRVNVRVTIVTGSQFGLANLSNGSYSTHLETNKRDYGTMSIGQPDPFEIKKMFSDSSAPALEKGYPTIQVGDTIAEVKVMLDRPGSVYYVAVPIEVKEPAGATDPAQITKFSAPVLPIVHDPNHTLKPSVLDDNKPLPIIVPTSGADSIPTNPLYLSSPGVTTITDGKFGGSVQYGVIEAPEGGNEETIRIENLLPSTMYYLYLVTKGTTAIYSDYAQCYRFQTVAAVRPVITMDINGTNVNVTVDKDSKLDYILVLTGEEDSKFHEPFSKYLRDDLSASDNAILAEYDSDITVLEAMSKDRLNGTTPIGTLFDLYASEAAKNQFAGLIRNQDVSGTDIVMKGSGDFWSKDPFKEIPCTGMTGSNYYTLLAVGRSTMGSGDAFRVIWPVFQRDTEWLLVKGIQPYGEFETDSAGNYLPKVKNGVITLTFGEELYYRTQGSTNQEIRPVDNCPRFHINNNVNSSHTAIGDTVTSTAVSGITVATTTDVRDHEKNIESITLNITSAFAGASINFSGRLCDRSGNMHDGDPLIITLTVEPVLNNNGDIINYTLGCTIPASWDGRGQTN